MAESQLPSILDKIKPGIDLLEEIVSLGMEVIKGLMDVVSCLNWIQNLLIRKLAQPMRVVNFNVFPTSTKLAFLSDKTNDLGF